MVGPVAAGSGAIVDEFEEKPLQAPGLIGRSSRGTLDWHSTDARVAQEDIHRVSGGAGSALTYELKSPFDHVKLFAFSKSNQPAVDFL